MWRNVIQNFICLFCVYVIDDSVIRLCVSFFDFYDTGKIRLFFLQESVNFSIHQ